MGTVSTIFRACLVYIACYWLYTGQLGISLAYYVLILLRTVLFQLFVGLIIIKLCSQGFRNAWIILGLSFESGRVPIMLANSIVWGREFVEGR